MPGNGNGGKTGALVEYKLRSRRPGAISPPTEAAAALAVPVPHGLGPYVETLLLPPAQALVVI